MVNKLINKLIRAIGGLLYWAGSRSDWAMRLICRVALLAAWMAMGFVWSHPEDEQAEALDRLWEEIDNVARPSQLPRKNALLNESAQ